MNERIKELASCNERIQSFFETGPVQRAAIEQFAELIIRECMEWCDAHATINGTAQQIRNSIKNYFGVEE